MTQFRIQPRLKDQTSDQRFGALSQPISTSSLGRAGDFETEFNHVASDSINHIYEMNRYDCVYVSRSVMSDFLRPHGLQPTRLLCPWSSPGKNTGVGGHSLLHGIFPTQGSNLGLPHCKWILYRLSHQGSPYEMKLHQRHGTPRLRQTVPVSDIPVGPETPAK